MSIPVVTPADVQTRPSRTKIASRSTSIRGYERPRRSHDDQCVAARLPSRMPARATMKAPSHTEPMRRTTRDARTSQPMSSWLADASSSARSAPPTTSTVSFACGRRDESLRVVTEVPEVSAMVLPAAATMTS
jgi:hypothetical protein